MSQKGGGEAAPATEYTGNGMLDNHFLSLTTWSWVSRLIKLGSNVQFSDLDQLQPEDTAQQLQFEMWSAWEAELKQTERKPSLWRVLWSVFRVRFISMGLIMLPYTAASILQPMMLFQLVKFVSDPTQTIGWGFLWCCIMLLATATQFNCHHWYFWCSMKMGAIARASLGSLIYTKALRLPAASLAQTTTGQIVNLISNDAEKFDELAKFMHYIWVSPLMVIISFVLIYQQVGIAALAGFAVLVLSIPIQSRMSQRFSEIRKVTIGYTDSRIKTINEILVGATVMKLYAWEEALEKSVAAMRQGEIESISNAASLKSINLSISIVSGPLVYLATFVTFLVTTGLDGTDGLTPARVFTTMSLFSAVRFALTSALPYAVEKLAECNIAVGRLEAYLHLPELDQSMNANQAAEPLDAGAIEIRDTSFAWVSPKYNANVTVPVEDPPVILHNLNISIKPGSLVAVVGTVGAGKSSLLSAILGEMCQTADSKGCVRVGGTSSISTQKSWIFGGSLQDNITFYRPFDRQRYERVVRACQLTADINQLHAGDSTIIGERGVNLSGGQRARVSLARALYNDSTDIFLLDDPLAAVDAVVGARLFRYVIGRGKHSLLRDKTRVLVTHHTHFLPEVDHVIVLQNGAVAFSGSYEQLQQSDIDLVSLTQNKVADSKTPVALASDVNAEQKQIEDSEFELSLTQPVDIREIKLDELSITMAEGKQTGSVGVGIVPALASAAGGWAPLVSVFGLMILSQASSNVCDWFFARWSSLSFSDQHLVFNFWLYAVLVAILIVLTLVRTRFFFTVFLRAASELHSRMFKGVLYAPMRFFESQPSGRVLNRFAKDQGIVDDIFPNTIMDFFSCLFQTFGYVILILIINPWPILVIIPIVPLFINLRSDFIAAARELKRMDALTRSPIYAFFSSTLAGLITVRGFRQQDAMMRVFLDSVAANTKSYLGFVYVNRWFGYRLDCFSSLVVLATSFSSVILRDVALNSTSTGYGVSLSPALVGLSLTYCLGLTALFQWMIRQSAEVENQLTSVERIHEYGEIVPEGVRRNLTDPPPADWPSQGQITLDKVCMRYREGLDLVLNDLNVNIQPRDKIGICGRTGAGKSSLLSMLFRLVEPCGGRVLIDGRDTQSIGLYDLRSKLSIIPQEPVIFSGTIRYNLDPFEQYTDDAIWDALQAVQLADMVRASGAGLQMPMAEYGSNLSAGECQLVCVARALLKPVKILLVDEATANVDRTTDEVVQRLLRTRFADRTVLTIAHRMLTILDSTKILAMQRGTAMQFDSPMVLCAPLQSEAKQAPEQMGLVAQLAAESHISWNDVAAINRAAVAE